MTILAIDLGTAKVCCFYVDKSGSPIVVTDPKHRRSFPSAVWSAGPGKERIVGYGAQARIAMTPAPIVGIKRMVGSGQRVMLGGVPVTPAEAAAELFAHARKLAESITLEAVFAVTVTVPAYFDAPSKFDLYTAAVSAFFDGDDAAAKRRLSFEIDCIAAAYAYTRDDPVPSLRILVYDFGATFNVALLEKTTDSGFDIIHIAGDLDGGGDSIDYRLSLWIRYCLIGGKSDLIYRLVGSNRYGLQEGYKYLQQVLSDEPRSLGDALRLEDRDLLIPEKPYYDLNPKLSDGRELFRAERLRILAENIKRELTDSAEAVIVQQGIFEDNNGEVVDFDLAISRADFELLIGDIVTATVDQAMSVVNQGGLQRYDVDRVLLAGGSSRMPIVKRRLQAEFSCPILLKEPDLVVAHGAARCAQERYGAELKLPRDPVLTVPPYIAHGIDTAQQSQTPLRVFLCHASADKSRVWELYKHLRDDGFDPWLDVENLFPGQEWEPEITKAVRTSEVVLVCLSPSSISKHGFVQKEIKTALDIADEKPPGTIFIIPVILDQCPVPERLRRWQWVNLVEAKGYHRLLESLWLRTSMR
jgi:hypothetical protein